VNSRVLRTGDRAIPYFLILAATRRLSVSVYPDLTVRVRAPLDADDAAIEHRLRHRLPWVLRQLRMFERYHPLPAPRTYVSGETHLYLGRQYRLRVRRGQEAVRLSGPFLMVTHPNRPSPRLVQDMVRGWYGMRAHAVLPRRLTRVLDQAPWLARSEPRLRISDMTTRWGSCGPSGVISLSIELVKAPVTCIDYVVAHELCHRLEMRHTPRFYALLSRVLPGWEQVRERLNRAVR
jgi:predicted metal-dependent hydrolase